MCWVLPRHTEVCVYTLCWSTGPRDFSSCGSRPINDTGVVHGDAIRHSSSWETQRSLSPASAPTSDSAFLCADVARDSSSWKTPASEPTGASASLRLVATWYLTRISCHLLHLPVFLRVDATRPSSNCVPFVSFTYWLLIITCWRHSPFFKVSPFVLLHLPSVQCRYQ
jgi:hypothetical protein